MKDTICDAEDKRPLINPGPGDGLLWPKPALGELGVDMHNSCRLFTISPLSSGFLVSGIFQTAASRSRLFPAEMRAHPSQTFSLLAGVKPSCDNQHLFTVQTARHSTHVLMSRAPRPCSGLFAVMQVSIWFLETHKKCGLRRPGLTLETAFETPSFKKGKFSVEDSTFCFPAL